MINRTVDGAVIIVSTSQSGLSSHRTVSKSGSEISENVSTMLRFDQTAEGVMKINSRALDQSQLKRYDKNEKHLAASLAHTSKGKNSDINLVNT